MLRRSWHRLVNVFRSGRAEDELARETSAHLALLEDDHRRRGLTAEAATVAARRAFGGIEQMKDRRRATEVDPMIALRGEQELRRRSTQNAQNPRTPC